MEEAGALSFLTEQVTGPELEVPPALQTLPSKAVPRVRTQRPLRLRTSPLLRAVGVQGCRKPSLKVKVLGRVAAREPGRERVCVCMLTPACMSPSERRNVSFSEKWKVSSDACRATCFLDTVPSTAGLSGSRSVGRELGLLCGAPSRGASLLSRLGTGLPDLRGPHTSCTGSHLPPALLRASWGPSQSHGGSSTWGQCPGHPSRLLRVGRGARG